MAGSSREQRLRLQTGREQSCDGRAGEATATATCECAFSRERPLPRHQQRSTSQPGPSTPTERGSSGHLPRETVAWRQLVARHCLLLLPWRWRTRGWPRGTSGSPNSAPSAREPAGHRAVVLPSAGLPMAQGAPWRAPTTSTPSRAMRARRARSESVPA
eukprot:4962410-Prymnesium_polylepis.1